MTTRRSSRDAPAPKVHEESVIAADYDPGSIVAGDESHTRFIPKNGPIWTADISENTNTARPKTSTPAQPQISLKSVKEPSKLAAPVAAASSGARSGDQKHPPSPGKRNPNTHLTEENDRLAKHNAARRTSKGAPPEAPFNTLPVNHAPPGESPKNNLRSIKKKRTGGIAVLPGAVAVGAQENLKVAQPQLQTATPVWTADGPNKEMEDVVKGLPNFEEREVPVRPNTVHTQLHTGGVNTNTGPSQHSISTITPEPQRSNYNVNAPPPDVEEGPDRWSVDANPKQSAWHSNNRKYCLVAAIFCLLIVGGIAAVVAVVVTGGDDKPESTNVTEVPVTTAPVTLLPPTSSDGDLVDVSNTTATSVTIKPSEDTVPPVGGTSAPTDTKAPAVDTELPETSSPTTGVVVTEAPSSVPAIQVTTGEPTIASTNLTLTTDEPTTGEDASAEPTAEEEPSMSPSITPDVPTIAPTEATPGIGQPIPSSTTAPVETLSPEIGQPFPSNTAAPVEISSPGIGVPFPVATPEPTAGNSDIGVPIPSDNSQTLVIPVVPST